MTILTAQMPLDKNGIGLCDFQTEKKSGGMGKSSCP